MRYALGLDLAGRSLAVAVDRGDGAVPVPSGSAGPDRLDRLVEAVGDPWAHLSSRAWPRALPGDTRTASAGDHRGTAAAAVAALVASALTRVEKAEGAAPDAVVVTCPATWGPYRTALLHDALRHAGCGDARVVADAVALVVHADPAAPGDARVAVLDVREEAVTVSVVRRSASAPPELVGTARTIPDLGTADVPDAVLTHVRDVVSAQQDADGSAGAVLDGAPPTAAARLRARAERASETLLAGEPVVLDADPLAPGREVRMVPLELDARLRPRTARAVAAAAAFVAGSAPDGVDAVLLAGRLATLPLVAEEVAARFEAPLVVVPDAGGAAACGAAALAPSLPPLEEPVAGAAGDPAARGHRATPRRRRPRPLRLAALAGTGVVLLGALAVAVSQDAFAAEAGDATAVVVRSDAG